MGKKVKGKKNAYAMPASDSDSSSASSASDASSGDEAPRAAKPSASSSTKKNKKSGLKTNAKASAASTGADDEGDGAEKGSASPSAGAAAPKKGGNKKGKKNRRQEEEDLEVDYEALLAEEEGGEADKAPPSVSAPVPKATPSSVSNNKDDDDAEEASPETTAGDETRVKSKKEKEKERKQRQKEAEKKKKQQQQQAANKNTTGGGDAGVSFSSSAAAAATTGATATATATASGSATGKAAAGKGGKSSAALNAIREMQIQLQKAEEEQKRREEEARAAEAERIRLIEVEEKRKADLKAAKKQREKEKKEQLRKEGKLLSKAEKERAAHNAARLEQLKASGAVVIAALEDDGASDASGVEKKPRRIVYDNRKKKGKGAQLSGSPSVDQQQQQQKGAMDALQQTMASVSIDDDDDADKKKKKEEAARNATPGSGPASDAAGSAHEMEVEEEEDDVADDWEAVADSWENALDEDSDENEDEDEEEDDRRSKTQQKDAGKQKATATGSSGQAGKGSTSNSKSKKPNGTSKTKQGKTKTPSKAQKGRARGDKDNDSAEESSDSDSDSDSDDSDSDGSTSDSSESETEAERKEREQRERIEKRKQAAEAAKTLDDLRSPICCILGHVDTGKTKLLDKIRQTNVQEGEAGGITQQIGATYMPIDAIQKKCEVINTSGKIQFKVPGLLVIDTPGHESFSNLRRRGNEICNIAVLVIDIMHGLEPQTIESMNMLRSSKTPFVVALNKVDRLYEWQSIPNNGIRDSLEKQSRSTANEFEDRLTKIKLALSEHGFNSEVYWKNTSFKEYVAIVPTSAFTGEGIADLLMLVLGLTQKMMAQDLMYSAELQATVLEVKYTEGHGYTIDVILVNGVLKEGDRIVVCGTNGAIATNVRSLLTPQPMKELRIKSAYVAHKECKAALGLKIAANELESAIAGSKLVVVQPGDDEELIKRDLQQDIDQLMNSIEKQERGVYVMASTLGSLEALMDFLKKEKIPVASVAIGNVHKKDIIKASTALEKNKEYAVILAFDVKMDKEVADYAEEQGVRVFMADTIYRLVDGENAFAAYMKNIKETKKKESAAKAIWPCVLKIVPGCVFNRADPIIVGVEIVEGTLRLGTPICVPAKECVVLGKAASIEHDHKHQEVAKKGQQVALKLEAGNEGSRVFGRHFEEKDMLCSKISRESIEVLKENFRDEVTKEEWVLIKKLKTTLGVI